VLLWTVTAAVLAAAAPVTYLKNPNAAAITALRARIISRFTELEEERAAIGAELDALTREGTAAPNPDLLDALPRLGDILDCAPGPAEPSTSPPAPGYPSRIQRVPLSGTY
jgi:hypothetical protein